MPQMTLSGISTTRFRVTRGTLTVQAQVDTSLAEKKCTSCVLIPAQIFTDADIQTYADLLFDEGSYSLFMPYEFRSIEDLSAACSAWEDTFKCYEDLLDKSRNI